MELLGRDDERDIFTGPGRIEISSETEIRFFMHGTPRDAELALRKYRESKADPYDHIKRFRLKATDYRGVEWLGGYVTNLNFSVDHDRGWPLTGEIESLMTIATGHWVSKSCGVELLLIPPVALPMTGKLTTKSYVGDQEVSSSGALCQHKLNVLGTTISFDLDPARQALWITGNCSEELRHPYAENWLTEPLRILLGVPVYPRLVARNFGDGKAQVSLRPSPQRKVASVVGLLHPAAIGAGRTEDFWRLYSDILTFIVKAGKFDANPITRLYEELSQALSGSRWILTLSLASAAESIVNDLMNGADRESEYGDASLDSMKTHIKGWDGDAKLRERMLSNLGMISKRSALSFMRTLGADGAVNPAHVITWSRIRNSVMHGALVEPWSSVEGDGHLQEMIKLVHDLTRARIKG